MSGVQWDSVRSMRERVADVVDEMKNELKVHIQSRDEYVDVVHEDTKRVFKARVRGADEAKVVAEWELLLLRPEVAAQYAYVRHISQEGAGFKRELQGCVHPLRE